MNDYVYEDYLAHYGVLGMKWGVRRSSASRDASLAIRSRKLAAKSTAQAKEAKTMADYDSNGSKYLVRSNRYMKRANKLAGKMSDGGKSVKNTEEFARMANANKEAAKNYVERTRNERISSLVKSTTVSTGASLVGMAMGMPIGLVYMDAGPKYKLKHSDELSDILVHWGEKEDHKYIAKVKRPNGKYRYFYDREEYMNFLNKGKKKAENLLGKLKNKAEDVSKKVKSASDNDDKKSKGKSLTDKFSNNEAKGVVFLFKRDTVKKAVDWMANKFGFSKKDDVDENATITDKEKKGHKYIAKVETSSGKYRYFYDQDEYDAYIERLEYQKNEPNFLKHLKDIGIDDIFTRDENMDKVNELFNPFDEKTSQNCTNCSAAYELRMRGYDVEAKIRDNKYNGRGDRFWDYFEDPEVLCVYGDGSTFAADEKFTRKVYDNKLTQKDCDKNERETEFYTNKERYTGESIQKAIKDNNPPGSRGMIDVEWKNGSAHSIVYEVNKSGKVIIRDSQTYDVYDTTELANNVSKVRICRTDNLQVKKDILNAVTTNKDEQREMYMDDGKVHYASHMESKNGGESKKVYHDVELKHD